MVRKVARNDFNFFEFIKFRFMAQDVIYPGEGSMSTRKKGEIIPSIFSDHNAVRLDLNYRRKTIKNSNI